MKKTTVHSPRTRSERTHGPRVVIGIDFGSSLTKVVARPRNSQTGWVADLDFTGEPSSIPQCLTPSALAMDEDGRLWFGRRAQDRPPQDKRWLHLKEEILEITSPWPTPADFRMAAYLSWVFTQIGHFLDHPDRMGPESRTEILQLAIPRLGDTFDNLRRRYLRNIQLAWKVVIEEGLKVIQSLPHVELQERFDALSESPLIAREHRLFEVLDESLAPVVCFSQSSRFRPGVHLVVDVGAATTDLSVNLLTSTLGDQKVLCYENASVHVGGNRLDQAREVAVELTQIEDTIHRLWTSGYLKDHPNPAARKKWQRTTLVALGGGSLREKDVRIWMEHLRHPGSEHHFSDAELLKEHLRPEALRIFSSTGRLGDEVRRFLGVAHGLSTHVRQWPTYFESPRELLPPDDVDFPMTLNLE